MLSIEELYTQYERSIEKQKSTIYDNRKRLHEAHRKHNLGEVARLNKLLHVLYEEKLEMEGAAVSLREYLS
jgi:hypothetical protein